VTYITAPAFTEKYHFDVSTLWKGELCTTQSTINMKLLHKGKEFIMNTRMKGGEKLIALGAMLLSLLMPFIFCISHSHSAETVVVDKSFNGREIKVRTGSMIRVNLEELGAAGYAWSIKDLDSEHFEVLSSGTKSVPPPGDITGAPVIRTWLISAKKEGKAELKFLHYRPWEGEKNASDTFVLKVRIIP
jgi:predicted secreted protein